ncbi:MAG: hypothetical protein ACLTG0_17325 [Oscillibacter sp.]
MKATAGAGGSISPSGSVSVREGRDQTFTITPDKSYAVSNVKIDGKSIGAVKSYTFEECPQNPYHRGHLYEGQRQPPDRRVCGCSHRQLL